MLQGVVFDLDGTLLDTEKLYRRFWVEAARQMGYPMEDRHALMVRSMAAAVLPLLVMRLWRFRCVRTLLRVSLPTISRVLAHTSRTFFSSGRTNELHAYIVLSHTNTHTSTKT